MVRQNCFGDYDKRITEGRKCAMCQDCGERQLKTDTKNKPAVGWPEYRTPGEYEALGAEIGKTTDEKQAAYGNSFGRAGDILRILYPDGIKIEQYDDALAVARILDKLFRIATDRDALGESPYRDIAGYGLLGAMVKK